MKKFLSIALLSASVSLQALGQCRLIDLPTQSNPAPRNGYKIVFNEEFNYDPNDPNDLWEHSPWRFIPQNNGSVIGYDEIWKGSNFDNYGEINDRSQATVYRSGGNGYLRLRAQEIPGFRYGPNGVRDIHFKSGMIRFRELFFTPAEYAPNSHLPPGFVGPTSVPYTPYSIGYARGIFEIRCKMPRGKGTNQCFWQFCWNSGNEFDMFESDSNNKTGLSNNVHDWSGTRKQCGANYIKQSPGNLADDFHVYTMVWTPDKATFFFDGKEIRTVPMSSNQANTTDIVSRERSTDLITNLSVWKDAYPDLEDWNFDASGWAYTDFDIDYIRVYQPTQYDVNDVTAVYPPYKTEDGWKRTDLEPAVPVTPNLDPRDIALTPGSLSATPSGQVAYNGRDGVMRRYYRQGATYQYERINPSGGYQSYMNVKGDVVVQEDASGNRLFYKGTDNRIHYFYGNTGAWNHDWAVHDWSDPLVSNAPGALAVVNGGLLFYRGDDNRIHKMEWMGPQRRWEHRLLPLDAASNIPASEQQVDGSIIVNEAGQVFYVGGDGQIQSYYMDSNGYTHSWLSPTFWNNPSSLVSNEYGSLCLHPDGVVFRGKNDNLLHYFSWTNSGGWQDHSFISSSGAMSSSQSQVPIVGKISADAAGNVYYRGLDNKMQFYYRNGSDWSHAWPSSWEYHTPQTIMMDKDNFSLASSGPPIFFQNTDGYMSYFNWEKCEQVLCEVSVDGGVSHPASDAGGVYRVSNPGNAGSTTGAASASRVTASPIESLQIYPNPATDQLTIAGGGSEAVTVVIFDLTGRAVLKHTALGKAPISLSQLPAGAYTVRLQQGTVTSHQRLNITR